MISYLIGHASELLQALFQHLDLTLTSLGIALIIALPAGFILSRKRQFSQFVLGLFSALYTIPSLALLAMLIPLFGLGQKPALVALVAYAQFILLRNIVLGFQSVDPSVLEAGRGMGMNASTLFLRVELPLALPMILGGIRLAAVTLVSLATVAAWVNAGGLGVILFEGIYQDDPFRLAVGTLLLAGFALLLNGFLQSFENDALANARGELTSDFSVS